MIEARVAVLYWMTTHVADKNIGRNWFMKLWLVLPLGLAAPLKPSPKLIFREGLVGVGLMTNAVAH